VRKKVVVFLVFLVVFICASFVFPGPFLHAASAEAMLQPESVGGLPPLLSVSKLQSRDVKNQTLHMSIGLALTNQDQLSAFLQSLYNPSSPNYHQYLTQDEFAQRFGPTDVQRQAVIDYLTRQAFSVTQVYPDLVDFSGSMSKAERVFGVSINDYLAPDGRVFYSNATAPSLPAYLASFITSVSGLDNANRFSHPPILGQKAPALKPHAAAALPGCRAKRRQPGSLYSKSICQSL